MYLEGSFSLHRCLTFSHIYTRARAFVCVYDKWLNIYSFVPCRSNMEMEIRLPLSISSRLNRLEHCMKCACIVLCTHEFCIYFDHFTVNCTLNRWYTLFLSIRINYHRRNNIAWENRENGTARDVSYIYSFIYLRVEWTSWTLRFVLRFLFSLSISYLSASPILLASLNIKINKWLLPWILHQFKVDFGSFQPI